VSVVVRLHAAVRDAARTGSLVVEAEKVEELRPALARACPPIADRLPFCRFALGDEFVGDGAPLPPDAVVDCIPPVSGG